MVDSAEQLKAEWVAGKKRVGVTAGASAPEVLVENELMRGSRRSALEPCASSRAWTKRGVHPAARAGLARPRPR